MNRNLNHIYIHLIWSVKYRDNSLNERAMKGIINFIFQHFKETKSKIISSNGYKDHLHILLKPDLNESISKIVKDIKGSSSNWINKNEKITGRFSWQRGFAAYSISPDAVENVKQYISNQQIHHGTQG